MGWSLLTIVIEGSASIMPLVRLPAFFVRRRISLGSSASSFTIRLLMLRMMSVTSSITPGIELNSWSAPLRRMWVTAAPSSELSRMRRRLLPTVVPKPRSKGSAVNRAYVSVETCSSRTTRDGNSNPRQRILMTVSLCPRPNRGRFPPATVGGHLSSTSPGDTSWGFLISDCRLPIAKWEFKSAIGNGNRQLFSDSSLLGRPSAVVRQRGDVLDAGDLQSCVLDLEDRLLASGAGALDLDLDLDHPVLARLAGGLLRGASRGEGGALARALEADRPGRAPRDRLTVGVGDRDHRVVERRLDVRHAARHALAELLLRRA